VADWAIIESYRIKIPADMMFYKELWHIIQACIDIYLLFLLIYIIKTKLIKIKHWTDVAGLLLIAALLRDMSRTIIVGVGTTSWIDLYVSGWIRLCIWTSMIFFSFIFVHFYLKREESIYGEND
jgi:hypothetical protein